MWCFDEIMLFGGASKESLYQLEGRGCYKTGRAETIPCLQTGQESPEEGRCAHCQSLPRGELFPREKKRPRLHSQAGASPPRLHGVTKSWTRLSYFTLTQAYIFISLFVLLGVRRPYLTHFCSPSVQQQGCSINNYEMKEYVNKRICLSLRKT